MKTYFKLQFTFINRKFKDAGLEPWMAYVIIAIFFTLGSNLLFSKAPYSHIVYSLLGIGFVLKLSEKRRNEFLKQTFREYRKLRIIENSIVMLPFVVVLGCKEAYLILVLLCLVGVILAFITLKPFNGFVIPAPFFKRLYEFQVGFRKLFYVYPVLYYLTYKAVEVENPNLGIGALIGLFIVSISYYSKPEKSYFVWNNNKSPRFFLRDKIKVAILYTSVLSIPIFLIYGLLLPANLELLLVFYLLGCIYLSTFILMKYSDNFESGIVIYQMIIYVLGVVFPPFLLFVFPFFYKKSIKQFILAPNKFGVLF